MANDGAIRVGLPEGVEIIGGPTAEAGRVLTPEALAFVADLERTFGTRRKELLARRDEVQTRIHAGVEQLAQQVLQVDFSVLIAEPGPRGFKHQKADMLYGKNKIL